MKNFKFSIAWLTVLALIFTSCSKEETDSPIQDEEVVQLTFGSILNDFQDQNKQFTPGEVCREDDPAYVMVAITDEGGAYIDDGDADADDLFQVDLKWNTNLGVWETLYSPQLGLPAGNYQLEHFVVYDAGGDVLWVAPQAGGSYGSYVGNALPQPFVLAAGTKPYITVDVLCFISRNEDAYGYVFFDLNPIPVENSYCVFVNYCDDETGREYPAYFEVDVWTDDFEGQNQIDLNMDMNSIDTTGDWPAASVLCFALPDLGEEAVFYVRVTVLDHNGLDYTVNPDDFYDFTMTQADIDVQRNSEPPYRHVRINCGPDGGGGDDCQLPAACVLDVDPTTLDPGCNLISLDGADAEGFVEINNVDDLSVINSVGEEFGVASLEVNGNDVEITLDGSLDADRLLSYAIEIRPSINGVMSNTCWESRCSNLVGEDRLDPVTHLLNGYDYSYPFYLKVNAVVCGEIVAPE